MSSSDRKVYRVGEITRMIKVSLERTFGETWIEGEISNLRKPSSGHIYFTLKDESAQIRAVMFRGDQRGLNFQPADGVMIMACGRITVYEKSGDYQIVISRMEQGGKGSLQAAFEALKRKLQAEGLFDRERKRPIPLLPRRIGIVTSPTGAAIQDMLKVFTRFPELHIVIAPCRVQGDGAAAEIAEGIRLLNEMGGFDAMIVGRGGGSIEDLWSFNEEIVARAIAASRIPVISAVGHEIDFTISDFTADLRAPTPTAAAEEIVNRRNIFIQKTDEYRMRLARSLKESVLEARNRLISAGKSPVFTEPGNIVRQQRMRMSEYALRMKHSIRGRLGELRQQLDDAGLRIAHRTENTAAAARQNVKRIEAQLRALNPEGVLQRGYSITRDEKGKVLRDASDLASGNRVVTNLAKGKFESQVISSS